MRKLIKYPFLLFWISINILIFVASTPASQIFFRDIFNQTTTEQPIRVLEELNPEAATLLKMVDSNGLEKRLAPTESVSSEVIFKNH